MTKQDPDVDENNFHQISFNTKQTSLHFFFDNIINNSIKKTY